MTQSINKQGGTLAAIESETHLFQVGGEMLCADAMPRSHNAALEQREGILNGVRVDISHDIDLAAMIDGLVLFCWNASAIHGVGIGHKIIRHNHVNILADVLSDELRDGSSLGIAGMKKSHFAVPLPDSEYDFFVIPARLVSASPDLSADIGFVYLYDAIEHGPCGFPHSGTDAMAEIPCGLIAADSERSLNLAGRNAFLGFTEQQGRRKPFNQGQVRIIEDRARKDGELIVTVFAVEKLLFGFQFGSVGLAAGAARSFGPAEPHKELSAFIIAAKHGLYVN
jgi:hypothetical protein